MAPPAPRRALSLPLAPALLALLALLAVPPLPAAAQEDESVEVPSEPELDLVELEQQRQIIARTNSVRARVSRYMNAAYEKFEEEDPEEAQRLLHRILESRLNRVEKAYVHRILGHVTYGAGDPEKAIEAFQQALAQEALLVKDEAALRLNIVQLYAQLQQWRDVIAAVEQYLPYARRPEPIAHFLQAIAHYQLDELDPAIASVREALEIASSPRESWLRLLAALYSQKEDYEKATPVLEELVLRFPKKQYWVQLSLIHGVREDYQTSLAVQQVAYAQGFLTEDEELRRLARSYLYNELPYPAAKVLEKGIEDGAIETDSDAYELLGNSWIAAREYDRALSPLRKAAELSETGDLYVRLGQVLMQREQWDESATMFERALEKGDLDHRGNVDLLLGIAYYNAENLPSARRSFAKARQHEETREAAERWMTHLANESGASEAG